MGLREKSEQWTDQAGRVMAVEDAETNVPVLQLTQSFLSLRICRHSRPRLLRVEARHMDERTAPVILTVATGGRVLRQIVTVLGHPRMSITLMALTIPVCPTTDRVEKHSMSRPQHRIHRSPFRIMLTAILILLSCIYRMAPREVCPPAQANGPCPGSWRAPECLSQGIQRLTLTPACP